ncbi:MAG: DNA photolyase family protein [Flavobacteriales bacterium]|nr:DNA photolyase family protein [Flavobacteriales bacterium]
MLEKVNIFWFRRDLRLEDNAGLYYALKSKNVLPIFIFDKEILEKLEDKVDARVEFIHHHIERLQQKLRSMDSDLKIFHDSPLEVYKKLFSQYDIDAVFSNEDYEPKAIARDKKIKALCEQHDTDFLSFKDQIIFHKDEVLKDDGKPYTVFTPYMRKWKSKMNPFYVKSYPTLKYKKGLHRFEASQCPSLETLGFEAANVEFPDDIIPENIIKDYHNTRDIPSIKGTSRLSVHLRFGTVSIRKLVAFAQNANEKWLNELIWRDFYMGNILHHFPDSVENAFKPAYDRVPWINDENQFEAWCQGKTGYPIVDAGMRELNATGFMHNRVRMIVASFLTKHLLIDWRWGEAYFAQKLLDYEMSSNVGGWQWAASSGCDAAPYFRVFNPKLQLEKFDPDLKYVRKWVPEFEDPFEYPKPIVDHKMARQRAIDTYKKALSN